MKNIILVAAIFCIMSLVSCKEARVPLTSPPELSSLQTISSKFVNIPILTKKSYDQARSELWNANLKEDFNLNITYNFLPTITTKSIKEFNGLVFLSLEEFMELYPKRESILLPIDEYVSDSIGVCQDSCHFPCSYPILSFTT